MMNIVEEQIKNLTVKELAEKIRLGEYSCVRVATEFLDVISKRQDLNAIIYCNPEAVVREASILDQEAQRGRFRGPLHGVPIMIKDNIHIRGVPNTAGTRCMKNFVPSQDATSVQRLREAGCIMIAKNNLHELASGVTSDNPAFGRVHNPFDSEYSAGGSSGGTGCAVAAKMSPAGLGTDTAGSVRIPASVNGICGFRPTNGRYPSEGITPISHLRDTVGTLAATVDDLILLDEVLSEEKFECELENLEGIRLGISRDIQCAGLASDVCLAFESALECLRHAGVDLIEVDYKSVQKHTDDCNSVINFYGARVDVDLYLRKFNIPLTIQELVDRIESPDIKLLYEQMVLSDKYKLEDYTKAVEVTRPALKRSVYELFSGNSIQAMVYPTIPCMPVKFVDIDEHTDDLLTRNLNTSALADMPSVSVPMGGLICSRLPIGLSLDGLENDDQLVLAMAKLMREAFEAKIRG
jgi:Asp-tRNA(Asn)/Glu-tRNA(Gln) amidotransferase A subunit family amidase